MMDIRWCWRASHVSSGLQLLLQAHKIRRLQRRQHPKQVLQHLPVFFCYPFQLVLHLDNKPNKFRPSLVKRWSFPPNLVGVVLLQGSDYLGHDHASNNGGVQHPRLDIPKGQATSTFWTRFTCNGEQWESCLSSERFADYEPLVLWLIVNLGRRLSNHPLTQSATQCTASVHALHILDGSKNKCDPAAIVCCLSPTGVMTNF